MPPRNKCTGPAAPRGAAAGAGFAPTDRAKRYIHPDVEHVARPEVGTQERFRGKKPPRSYRYDSFLAPELQWNAGCATVREWAEELLRYPEDLMPRAAVGDSEAAEAACAASRALRALQAPFLDWSGKGERTSFEVPALPHFVHERLSTQAILESVSGWKREQPVDLFGDPQDPIAERPFPNTLAWDALKRSLKADFDEFLLDHLVGETSAPFEPEHGNISVKVIDECGNELMVERTLQ